MLTDKNLYTPPNYETFQAPAPGQTYVDPVFKTVVKRLTDAMNTKDNAMGTPDAKVVTIGNEYSSVCPFSTDGKYLLLNHRSYFALYDGVTGKYIKDCRFDANRWIGASMEPRWRVKNADEFFFVTGNKLMVWNATTGKATVVQEFTEYLEIHAGGEGDLSEDGTTWALFGTLLSGEREIFLYDVEKGIKGKPLRVKGGFDNMYATPDNNVIVGWNQSGNQRFNGIELYDRNMNFLRQIEQAMGHQDVGRDTTGDEVLIWASAGDPTPEFGNTTGSVKIRLGDAKSTMVFNHGWGIATHTYCPRRPGWFLLSTYRTAESEMLPWKPYLGEILKIKMDGTEVQRMCHHRSRPLPRPHDYTSYPKATGGNADLSKIVYMSNFNLHKLKGYPPSYIDTYLIESASIPVLDPIEPPPPPPTPEPTPAPAPEPADILNGFHSVDLKSLEGREYWEHRKVIDGKLVTIAMYEK